jgi:hypothetical protein
MSCMQQQTHEVQQLQPEREEVKFDVLLEPIEHLAGKRLSGRGRLACFEAYRRSPEVFAELVRDAKQRARTSPLGFLCRLVEDGDHLYDEVTAAVERHRHEPCPECGTGAGFHIADCSRAKQGNSNRLPETSEGVQPNEEVQRLAALAREAQDGSA